VVSESGSLRGLQEAITNVTSVLNEEKKLLTFTSKITRAANVFAARVSADAAHRNAVFAALSD
jgi:hypothetical protein